MTARTRRSGRRVSVGGSVRVGEEGGRTVIHVLDRLKRWCAIHAAVLQDLSAEPLRNVRMQGEQIGHKCKEHRCLYDKSDMDLGYTTSSIYGVS